MYKNQEPRLLDISG